MKSEEQKSETLVQCRVDSQVYLRLKECVKEYHFSSVYELMQYVVTAFLRSVDIKTGVYDGDATEVEMARTFEGFENAASRLINTSEFHSKRFSLVDAIMIYAERKKKTYVSKAIEVVDGEDMNVSASRCRPLDVVLKRMHPRLYESLGEVGELMGEVKQEKIIRELVAQYKCRLRNDKSIADEFEVLGTEGRQAMDGSGVMAVSKHAKSVYDDG